MVLMQEESLQKPSFSGSVTDGHQKACLDPSWASIWDPFGPHLGSQNRSQSDPEAIQMGIGYGTSILRGVPQLGEGCDAPWNLDSLPQLYIYIYIYIQVSGCRPSSSQRGITLQNRCPISNAHLDGLWIDLGSILAPQMGPKSRPGGNADTLSDVHQSQIEKKKVLASFVLALSTLRRCNLTMKTQMF